MPKISVIVPIYNVEAYITKCAYSLFNQTLDDVEYVFVNDCTKDNSIEVLKTVLQNYPNRLEYVKIVNHDTNRGLPAARATGISYASGDYIIHSDSDDWMEPTLLEEMYCAAIGNDADLVYCDFNFVKQSGVVRYFAPKTADTKTETVNNWVNTKWTVIWNILAKRSIYQNNNIKFPIGIKYCEDFYVGIQLLCFSTKIVHVPQALHNYNMLNQSSILHLESRNQMNNDSAKVYDMILDILAKENLFGLCGKSVSWRFLDGMQHCVLDKLYFEKFKTLHPETHKYIMSCPYLNKKVRVLMWCLDKNLDVIVSGFIWIRHLLKS